MNVEELKVGDVIGLVWVRRYQHGATMRITKINRKTIIAVEVKGSYGGPCEVGHPLYKRGRPATEWSIHKNSNFVFYPDYDRDDVPARDVPYIPTITIIPVKLVDCLPIPAIVVFVARSTLWAIKK